MPITRANNIDIWYETFGNRKNPALLLIMGGCCQGILWPTEFCQQLVEAGFFVIRYDHRDTGLSTCFDFSKQPYNLNDMAQDAVGLLDYLKIKKFNLVGLSMGGPIAELLSVHFPQRTLSITLISSSSDFRPMNLAYAGLPAEVNSLSSPLDIYLQWMQKFVCAPPKNKLEHIELRLEGWRILCGDKVPFEEERYRALHTEFLDRIRNEASIANHLIVCSISEELIRAVPSQVKVPTLILHGSEDHIYPLDHGNALAALIPHAQYLTITGMGHIPNCHFYDMIINKIKAISTGYRSFELLM